MIILKRLFCLLLICVLFSGCSKPSGPPSLAVKPEIAVVEYSFGGVGEASFTLSSAQAAEVRAQAAERLAYPYADKMEAEKALDRLNYRVQVEQHGGTVAWDAEALLARVQQNNAAFLEAASFGYKAVEESYLREICTLILETAEQVLEVYPDIDRERISCNLANLKILYDTTMLDFAQVTEEWVLKVSNTGARMAELHKGEGSYRNVLIHETMHILQMGCVCESLGENASRRCGICVYWEDWPINSTDWSWFFEGSAERVTCNLTRAAPVTYTYMIGELCCLTMAALPDPAVKGNELESLSFYGEPERLFRLLGAETQAERLEVVQLMMAINVLQTDAEAFYEGLSEEEAAAVSDTLRPAIGMTLAGIFFENLADLLEGQTVPQEDVFFLLNTFEGLLSRQMSFNEEASQPFVERYRSLRSALLGEAETTYAAYTVKGEGMTLNAELSFLSEEERAFLLERNQYLADSFGLGNKI